jgi:hypothetical protein
MRCEVVLRRPANRISEWYFRRLHTRFDLISRVCTCFRFR